MYNNSLISSNIQAVFNFQLSHEFSLLYIYFYYDPNKVYTLQLVDMRIKSPNSQVFPSSPLFFPPCNSFHWISISLKLFWKRKKKKKKLFCRVSHSQGFAEYIPLVYLIWVLETWLDLSLFFCFCYLILN